jgi:cephalosporin hydroxylase
MIDTSFLTEGLKKVEGHLQTTTRTVDTFTEIYDIIKPSKVFEIGFNAGHSAYMSLTILPEVMYHSVDIGMHKYSAVNAEKLSEVFGDRFAYQEVDSQKIVASSMKGYDVVFVDGDHSVKGVSSDLNLCNSTAVPYILVDDYHPKWFKVVIELTEHYLNKDDFPYEMVKVFDYDSKDGNNSVALLKRVE